MHFYEAKNTSPAMGEENYECESILFSCMCCVTDPEVAYKAGDYLIKDVWADTKN